MIKITVPYCDITTNNSRDDYQFKLICLHQITDPLLQQTIHTKTLQYGSTSFTRTFRFTLVFRLYTYELLLNFFLKCTVLHLYHNGPPYSIGTSGNISLSNSNTFHVTSFIITRTEDCFKCEKFKAFKKSCSFLPSFEKVSPNTCRKTDTFSGNVSLRAKKSRPIV